MSDTRWTDPIIDEASAADPASSEDDEETARAVIEAYTAAVTGSQRNRAFDAALRAYRARHPDVPEAVARRRVAEILCFAGVKPVV